MQFTHNLGNWLRYDPTLVLSLYFRYSTWVFHNRAGIMRTYFTSKFEWKWSQLEWKWSEREWEWSQLECKWSQREWKWSKREWKWSQLECTWSKRAWKWSQLEWKWSQREWKLERVVRKRTRKQPSVIASRPFQIWCRSANFRKVYFILRL